MNQTGLAKIIRLLFTVAAVFALVAILVIVLTPGGYSVTTEGTEGGSITTTETLTFYEMQGPWGVFILFVFAALYYGVVHFYNLGKKWMAALFGTISIVMTVLALLSIGAFYSLSALLVLIGMVLMPFDNLG